MRTRNSLFDRVKNRGKKIVKRDFQTFETRVNRKSDCRNEKTRSDIAQRNLGLKKKKIQLKSMYPGDG